MKRHRNFSDNHLILIRKQKSRMHAYILVFQNVKKKRIEME